MGAARPKNPAPLAAGERSGIHADHHRKEADRKEMARRTKDHSHKVAKQNENPNTKESAELPL